MNDRYKVALRESIVIWQRRAVGIYDTSRCPLCSVDNSSFCEGCPIDEYTKTACESTPYYDWVEARHEFGYNSPDAMAAAKKELEFLKSLMI